MYLIQSELLIILSILKSLFNIKLVYHFNIFSVKNQYRQTFKIALDLMSNGHLEEYKNNSIQY